MKSYLCRVVNGAERRTPVDPENLAKALDCLDLAAEDEFKTWWYEKCARNQSVDPKKLTITVNRTGDLFAVDISRLTEESILKRAMAISRALTLVSGHAVVVSF
jgi:hypothetical protein